SAASSRRGCSPGARQAPVRAGAMTEKNRAGWDLLTVPCTTRSIARWLPSATAMRIFSGIQPTGRKHLGNYIGAITQYVAGQDRGEAIYCIVDLHATTVPYEPAELRERVYDTTAILLAAGLEPERCILFRQGDVAEHSELA